MAYLLILLAMLALAGAGALWFLDARERTPETPDRPARDPALELAPDPAPTPNPESKETPEREPVKPEALEPAALEPEVQELEVQEPEALEPEAQEDTLESVEQEAPRQSTAKPSRRSVPGLQLPGASRRERRAWAQSHDFDFVKSDEFLSGEWSRGAAASGAQPKDIASGSVYGHETNVMDLGGVTVLAMRTGEVSQMVVDFRRDGFESAPSSDLVQAGRVDDFEVYASDPAPVQRFVDARVRTALEQLPERVTAVWCESEWVLAQTDKNPTSDDVDNMLAPLALIADAARVLPPQTWRVVEFGYPTREMTGVEIEREAEVPDVAESPLVKRPEEPLELPTRTTGVVRGVITQRALGGDEVDAIAEDAETSQGEGTSQVADLTRVRRNQAPPSIFGD